MEGRAIDETRLHGRCQGKWEKGSVSVGCEVKDGGERLVYALKMAPGNDLRVRGTFEAGPVTLWLRELSGVDLGDGRPWATSAWLPSSIGYGLYAGEELVGVVSKGPGRGQLWMTPQGDDAVTEAVSQAAAILTLLQVDLQ